MRIEKYTIHHKDSICRSDGLILWIEAFADGVVAQSDIFVQVKELEDESRNQMEQREKEEAEEGPLATILGTMKRTITNADGLRFVTVLLSDDNSGFFLFSAKHLSFQYDQAIMKNLMWLTFIFFQERKFLWGQRSSHLHLF